MIKLVIVFFLLLTPKAHADTLCNQINVKRGIASIYARNLEGSPTTSGEVFSHKKLTAASNFYKLGVRVRVKNIKNGKSVIVKINDRMAHRMSRMGRIVDLSLAAAHKIGFTLKQGLIKVEVSEVVLN